MSTQGRLRNLISFDYSAVNGPIETLLFNIMWFKDSFKIIIIILCQFFVFECFESSSLRTLLNVTLIQMTKHISYDANKIRLVIR